MAALRWVMFAILCSSLISFSLSVAFAASPAQVPILTPAPTLTPTPTSTPTPVAPAQPGLGGESGGFLALLVFLAVVASLTATVNAVFFPVLIAALLGFSYSSVWVGLVTWMLVYGAKIVRDFVGK